MKKISIIIPTFNRADFLDQAINSILSQTSDDFEIIISDNASTDHTSNVVEKYKTDHRVHYHKNETNIGMVANWRKAIFEHSQCEWFIIMSDDDYFIDNNYISDALQILEEHQLSLLYANGYILNTRNGKMTTLKNSANGMANGVDIFISRGTITPQDFTLCNVIFKRSIAEKYNAFSENTNYSCDTELFLNSCLEGNAYFHNKTVSTYRIHGMNLIGQVEHNTELTVGNLNAFLSPYENSKGVLSDAQQKKYVQNTGLISMIRQACIVTFTSKDTTSIENINKIKNKHPALFRKATQSLLYKTELYLKKNKPLIYNKYSILSSLWKRIKIKLKHTF